MNEKLSRPQFNQMDTTEKQTLMESLADRYDICLLYTSKSRQSVPSLLPQCWNCCKGGCTDV